MMKAAVLSLLLVGCSALTLEDKAKTQVKEVKAKTEVKEVNAKTEVKEEKATKPSANGINYSLKAKDQVISNAKHSKEDLQKIHQESSTGAMKDVGPIDDYLEFWYVNTKKAKDRRQCMDKQMEEMNVKPHVFAAMTFKQCIESKDPDVVGCLTRSGNGDCVKKGLNPQAIATHGSAANSDLERAYHIVSNACSHKRMMSQMFKAHTDAKSKAKYALLLEDDVSFDRHDFVRKVVNFANMYDGKYNETWHMVQIDPFGSKCDKHIVGHFEGLPVWKPTNVNNNHECSNYWGAQALLVKIDAIPKIVHHMETTPTVPLDWLPAELDHGLAWHANIARNPEAINQFYDGTMHHQWVNFPSYCKKSIKESTIGA